MADTTKMDIAEIKKQYKAFLDLLEKRRGEILDGVANALKKSEEIDKLDGLKKSDYPILAAAILHNVDDLLAKEKKERAELKEKQEAEKKKLAAERAAKKAAKEAANTQVSASNNIAAAPAVNTAASNYTYSSSNVSGGGGVA